MRVADPEQCGGKAEEKPKEVPEIRFVWKNALRPTTSVIPSLIIVNPSPPLAMYLDRITRYGLTGSIGS